MQKIKSLTVEACRGIRDTTLDFDGKSLILHGENGVGKSSFVDSLELFFHGNITHLDEAMSTSTKRHTNHIHFSQKDTQITVDTQNPDIKMVWTFRNLQSQPENQLSFWEAGQKSNFILRRKQILEFVIAKPADRYQQIAQIIGVGDLDKIELNLMRRKDELQDEVERLGSQIGVVDRDIKSQLEIELLDEKTVLKGINLKLKNLKQPQLLSFDDIEAHKLKAIVGAKNPEQIQQAAEIQTSLQNLSGLETPITILNKYAGLWTAIDELTKSVELARALSYQQVLENGKRLIEEFQPELCPVCEQTIDHASLSKRLEERLELSVSAKEKSEKIVLLKGRLSGEINETIRVLRSLKKSFKKSDLDLELTRLDNYVGYLENLVSIIKPNPIRIRIAPIEEYKNASEVKKWYSFNRVAENKLKSQLKELMITENDQKALEAIDLLNGITEAWSHKQILNSQSQKKLHLSEQIRIAYNVFVDTKQKEIQSIYDEIQADMQKYYDSLHPNESHREIELKIDPKKRSSTEIMMGFHDRKDDPRAYQSEAHLDSLGFCTFMAFVKHFNVEFPLIILDDVVGTIDTQHRRRVCELLYSEFIDYQFLITTHDSLWFEELASYQRALDVSHLFSNIKILDWSLDEGIRLDRHRPRWQILEDRLDDGDKVSAGAHARRNLEWVLQEMVVNTQTKVVLNPTGKYDVSALYNDFRQRVTKLIPTVIGDNESVFKNLEADGIFGNLMVHNNINAENASIEEVRAFSNAVRALHDLFTCENGQFVKYHRGAKIISCKCRHIKWETK